MSKIHPPQDLLTTEAEGRKELTQYGVLPCLGRPYPPSYRTVLSDLTRSCSAASFQQSQMPAAGTVSYEMYTILYTDITENTQGRHGPALYVENDIIRVPALLATKKMVEKKANAILQRELPMITLSMSLIK
jgi:hypothetical protein